MVAEGRAAPTTIRRTTMVEGGEHRRLEQACASALPAVGPPKEGGPKRR